jgi:hypothetical protein
MLVRGRHAAKPSNVSMSARSKSALVGLLLIIVIAALVGGGLFLRPRFESEPPQIVVSPDVDVIGVAPM